MQPIHELLARIRWDAEFAQARFAIGYWDRVEGKVLRADLREIAWDAENPSFFDLVDEAGSVHAIPFHRVREVWRDGRLIWERHPPPGGRKVGADETVTACHPRRQELARQINPRFQQG